MDSSSQDKNLPATAQRLKKARDDGQMPRSKDLSNLMVLGGGSLILLALAPTGFEKLRTTLQSQLRFDHASLQQPGQMLQRLVDGFSQGLMLYLPLGLLVLAVAIGATVAAGSYALSTKPIMPDLGRLNPLKGIGRLFSKQQLFDTAKLFGVTAVVFVGGLAVPRLTRRALCHAGDAAAGGRHRATGQLDGARAWACCCWWWASSRSSTCRCRSSCTASAEDVAPGGEAGAQESPKATRR